MSTAIEKGSILIHRVFDVGGEISLVRAAQLVSADSGPGLKFATNTRKAIIIKESPLKVDLGEETLALPSGKFPIRVFARIWNYGVISVTMEMAIQPGTAWEDLVKTAAELEASQEVDLIAVSRKDSLKKRIMPAINGPAEWEVFEDYITYIIEKAPGIENPREFREKFRVPVQVVLQLVEALVDHSRCKCFFTSLGPTVFYHNTAFQPQPCVAL